MLTSARTTGNLFHDLMKVKYHQLVMLRDRGYDVSGEAGIISLYEEVDASFRLPENIDTPIDEIMENYYGPALRVYDPVIAAEPRREGIYPIGAKTVYGALSGLYRLRPDFDYYNEYPAKTALVWYTFNSGIEKHPGSQPKLPTEEAVKIINFYKIMVEAKVQIDIIITISNIPWSSAVIKEFEKDLKSKSLQFQFFLYHELMYNPTRHNFVPKHRKLKREEVIKLEREDGVSSRILAALLYVDALYRKSTKDNKKDPPTDPIVKWYDFRPGDIIEITSINYINESDIPVALRYRAVKYNIAPR